jgi:hypothetical protein
MAPVQCLDGFGRGDLPIALTRRGSKGGRKDLLVVIRAPYRPLKRRVACAIGCGRARRSADLPFGF